MFYIRCYVALIKMKKFKIYLNIDEAPTWYDDMLTFWLYCIIGVGILIIATVLIKIVIDNAT
jgi:hypothetical protein